MGLFDLVEQKSVLAVVLATSTPGGPHEELLLEMRTGEVVPSRHQLNILKKQYPSASSQVDNLIDELTSATKEIASKIDPERLLKLARNDDDTAADWLNGDDWPVIQDQHDHFLELAGRSICNSPPLEDERPRRPSDGIALKSGSATQKDDPHRHRLNQVRNSLDNIQDSLAELELLIKKHSARPSVTWVTVNEPSARHGHAGYVCVFDHEEKPTDRECSSEKTAQPSVGEKPQGSKEEALRVVRIMLVALNLRYLALTPVQRDIVNHRIFAKNKETLSVVGVRHNLSREALRQEQAKLIARALHPAVAGRMRSDLRKIGYSEGTLAESLMSRNNIDAITDAYRPGTPEADDIDKVLSIVLGKKVTTSQLMLEKRKPPVGPESRIDSVRGSSSAHKVLANNGIENLKDLANMDPTRASSWKYIRRATVSEIESMIATARSMLGLDATSSISTEPQTGNDESGQDDEDSGLRALLPARITTNPSWVEAAAKVLPADGSGLHAREILRLIVKDGHRDVEGMRTPENTLRRDLRVESQRKGRRVIQTGPSTFALPAADIS